MSSPRVTPGEDSVGWLSEQILAGSPGGLKDGLLIVIPFLRVPGFSGPRGA